MKLKYINHASILWSNDEETVNILSDPWFVGNAFLDGWSLMWKTDLENFAIPPNTYIWISHEHPDHFSPVTLHQLDEKIKDCVFLYQDTHDKRVVNWLKRFNYKYEELESGKIMELSADVRIMCRSVGTGDSYLIIEDSSGTFVNSNDSILLPADVRQLQSDCNKFQNVSVLTSQFGLAGKVGNSEDIESREIAVKQILSVVERQIKAIRPKHFMPSASMKFFSAVDNSYMNHEQTKLKDVLNLVKNTNALPLFLVPGGSWATSDQIPNPEVLITEYESVMNRSINTHQELASASNGNNNELESSLQEWWSTMKSYHQPVALLVLKFIPSSYRLTQLDFYLSDTSSIVSFVPKSKAKKQNTVVEVDSAVLKRALSDDFGIMSLIISARVQCSARDQKVLRTMGWLGSLKAANQRLTLLRILRLLSRSLSFLINQ